MIADKNNISTTTDNTESDSVDDTIKNISSNTNKSFLYDLINEIRI